MIGSLLILSLNLSVQISINKRLKQKLVCYFLCLFATQDRVEMVILFHDSAVTFRVKLSKAK